MALQIWDGVVETSTTTGTGAFALAGAVLGYQTFSAACTVGDTVHYLIEAIDGNGDRTGQWETGQGEYSATDELTRITYHDGTSYPAFTNFAAGTKRVSLSLVAWQARFQGALAYKSANQTTANFTTATALTFDAESYDTAAFHDNAVNTSRISIPVWASKVRLRGHVRVSSLTASNFVALYLYKNGSVAYIGSVGQVNFSNQTVMEIEISSPVLNVVGGTDYFELFLEIGVDTSVTVEADRTWFAVEVIH